MRKEGKEGGGGGEEWIFPRRKLDYSKPEVIEGEMEIRMEPFCRGIKRNFAQSGSNRDKLSPLFSSERRGDHASLRFRAFSNLILRLIF